MITDTDIKEVTMTRPAHADVPGAPNRDYIELRITDKDGARIYIACISREAAQAAADAINLAIGAKL
jgi:hypothetical protein